MRMLVVTGLLFATLLAIPPGRSTAQNSAPTFEASGPGVNIRSVPSVLGPRINELPLKKAFPIVARTPDSAWVALGGITATIAGWVPVGLGQVLGDIDPVPVQARPYLGARAGATAAKPLAWVKVTPNGRQLFAKAIAAGRDPRLFTIAGDSNSAWPKNLGAIVTGKIDYAADRVLGPVVARFDPSFAWMSVAVGGGFRAADMFLPERAPAVCKGEPMFPCELRRSNASVVFIQLGTGDKFVWHDYEANVRKMIDHALAQNVLPVLVTKADDLESIHGGAPLNFINDTVRALAAEYKLPLIDFYVGTRTLPVVPNPELPKRPFTQNGLLDEWGLYFHLSEQAFELRLRSTLLMMNALTGG